MDRKDLFPELNFAPTRIELENPNASFRTAAFQDVNRISPRQVESREIPETPLTVEESERILCSQLVQSKVADLDRHELEQRLAELLKSPEVRALNRSARDLAQRAGISEGQAMRLILEAVKELNKIWEKILIAEGYDQLNR